MKANVLVSLEGGKRYLRYRHGCRPIQPQTARFKAAHHTHRPVEKAKGLTISSRFEHSEAAGARKPYLATGQSRKGAAGASGVGDYLVEEIDRQAF